MKLSAAFDGLARENYFLKLVVKMQIVTTVFLLGIVYSLYDRVPLLIERTSRGLEIVNVIRPERTNSDLKEAVQLMMKARFDSGAVSPELFLNPKQLLLRDTEQKDMKARGMSQSVVVRNVVFDNDGVTADLDRVIAVGDLRSALKTKLKVSFEEISANELNRYGLLLSMAEPLQNKEASK